MIENMDNVLHKEKILVVEDDKAIRSLISTTLDQHQFEYTVASTGNQALNEATRNIYDIMLLDLGLPDLDGVDIIKKVRQWSMMFIIVVSARSEEGDKIDTLDADADDYLTKPFSVDELLARLRAALRRIHYTQSRESKDDHFFINGVLSIDYAANSVSVSDHEVHLAPTEYKLLCLLAKNVGKVLTYKQILASVWGNTLEQNIPSLRVIMATLRKKLEHSSESCTYIKTHVGIGYRMVRVENDK